VDSIIKNKSGKGKFNYLVSTTDVPIINAASISIPKDLRGVHAYHLECNKLKDFNEKISARTSGRNLK